MEASTYPGPVIATDVSVWLDALAGSHDRLCEIVSDLDDTVLAERSYCDDWTLAQVLSHLGSGAEIVCKTVDAVVAAEPPPSRDTYPEIWARWNAMTPEATRDETLSADGALVEKLEHLGDALDDLEFTLFGRLHVDAVGLLRVRLTEHALHTWDIAVALEPSTLVDGDSVSLLVDQLPLVVARLGKPAEALARPFALRVVTTGPAREFRIDVDDAVAMAPAGETGADHRVLHLPAEALLRLVYGRLDPSHAPLTEDEERPILDELQKVFPGF